jgi:SAM-dependent methyltransferase
MHRARLVLERYGPVGTVKQAARYARDTKRRRRTLGADREFDAETGADTAGIIPVWNLGVTGQLLAQCNRYEAVPATVFHDLMADVPVTGSVFVDVGCGKGRALLLARDYPFRRIVGVEFSQQLADIAARNLRDEPRAEVVCCDALNYRFPDGPLVVFANNPFDKAIMRQVLEGIPAAELVVLNPGSCLPDMPRLERVGENRYRLS